MSEKEPEYFDIAGVEGDDKEADSVAEGEAAIQEAEAVAEVAAEMASEPPVQNVVSRPPPEIALADHAKSAAAGGQYPTEDPGDETTVWSPRPGIIGCARQGFRKIR